MRAGYHPDDVDVYVDIVATRADDEEANKRGTKGNATSERLDAGEDVWGMPALCQHLGIEVMADTLRSWLGMGGGDSGGGGNAITTRPGFLPQMVDEAEQLLLSEGVAIFQRFDQLVRVVRLTDSIAEDSIGRTGGALVIKPVVGIWLREQPGRAARWQTVVTAQDLPMWWKAVMAEPDYGPQFIRIASGNRVGKILYRPEDVERWLASQEQNPEGAGDE